MFESRIKWGQLQLSNLLQTVTLICASPCSNDLHKKSNKDCVILPSALDTPFCLASAWPSYRATATARSLQGPYNPAQVASSASPTRAARSGVAAAEASSAAEGALFATASTARMSRPGVYLDSWIRCVSIASTRIARESSGSTEILPAASRCAGPRGSTGLSHRRSVASGNPAHETHAAAARRRVSARTISPMPTGGRSASARSNIVCGWLGPYSPAVLSAAARYTSLARAGSPCSANMCATGTRKSGKNEAYGWASIAAISASATAIASLLLRFHASDTRDIARSRRATSVA